MTIHPDGRLEGTPEELAAYQRAMQAAPVTVAPTVIIEKQVPVYIPSPSTAPAWPTWPYPDVWCGGSGTVTYDGPDLTITN